MNNQPECCRKLVEAGWEFHWCGDGVSFVAAEHPMGGKQSVVEVLRVGRNGFDRNEIGNAITALMNGDGSKPITPGWLDRCGVPKSTRGSVIVIYQIGVVGLRFTTTRIGWQCDNPVRSLTASIGSVPATIKTRGQLLSLLEMLGEPALVAP